MIQKLFYVAVLCVVSMIGNAQTQPSLLSVKGKYLTDDCGDTIVLRGVNLSSIYYGHSDFAKSHLVEIAKTGANSVRIVLMKTFKTWPAPNYNEVVNDLTPAHIEPLLQECVNLKLIPVLELHDWTGQPSEPSINGANGAVAWWTKNDIKNLLLKYQNYLIINLANEPSPAVSSTDAERQSLYNTYKTAISNMRAAGYTCPIMLDAMHWGKDHSIFTVHGNSLLNDDKIALSTAQGTTYSNGNLLFSVHLYWPKDTSGAPWWTHSSFMISTKFISMNDSNLPFVFGEIASHDVSEDWTDIAPGTSCSRFTAYEIDYELILQLTEDHQFGWFAWWWSSNCNSTAPQTHRNTLNMTNDPNGKFEGLEGPGNVIATTSQYSIKNTSKKPFKWVNGNCQLSVDKLGAPSSISVYPNPVNEFITIESTSEIKNVFLTDVAGKVVLNKEINGVFSAQVDISMLNKGIYFITVEDFNLNYGALKIVIK